MFSRPGWRPAAAPPRPPRPPPTAAATGPRARLRRIAHSTVFRVAVVLAAVAGLWLGGAALWATVLSRLHLHRHLSWYGLGLYGLAPAQQFESFEPRVPSLEFPRWDARCSQDPVFFGWRGHEVDEPGAVILDAHGALVWRNTDAANIDQNDVRPQLYRGERFLTFQMDGPAGNQSQGYWYMLDQSYEVRHRLRPGNNLPHADMHEFHITADDTALVITSIPVPYDLRSVGGPENGWVEACYLQELDIETGAVLFQWAALDHFPPNTTMEVQNNCRIDPRARFAGCGDAQDSAFDYLHLNSLAKDSHGNYLVSMRNTWAISYIDGTTGAVLWSLGAGTVNDFTDVTDPAATGGHYALDFAWQHHARWVEEGKVLSLFDNHYHRIGDPYGASGARVLELDIPNRTVRLRHLLQHPNRIKPESQGSAQHLANGNYMVGWGSSAAFTEFAPDGEVLCDGRFGAEMAFEFSPVSSYRVFRGEWVGMPTYPPSVAVVGNKAYVSWNGATEVDRWQVESLVVPAGQGQGTDDDDDDDDLQEEQKGVKVGKQEQNSPQDEAGEDVQVIVLAQVFKDGFETVIDLPKAAANTRIRIVALGSDDERLGTTDFLEVPDWSIWGLTPLFVMILGLIGLFLLAVCGAVLWWTCARRRSLGLMDDGGMYAPLEGEHEAWRDDDDDVIDVVELQEGLGSSRGEERRARRSRDRRRRNYRELGDEEQDDV